MVHVKSTTVKSNLENKSEFKVAVLSAKAKSPLEEIYSEVDCSNCVMPSLGPEKVIVCK